MLALASLVAALLASPSAGSPHTSPLPSEEYRHIDEEGQVRIEGQTEDGLPSGRWRFRYPDGEIAATGSFRDGLRVGKWRFKRPDGEKWVEGSFSKGVAQGTWKFWPDGEARAQSLKLEVAEGRRGKGWLLDGVPHGRWEFHWEGGQPMLTIQLDRGSLVGPGDFWHADGTLDPLLYRAAPIEAWLPNALWEAPQLPGLQQEEHLPSTTPAAPRASLASDFDTKQRSAVNEALETLLAEKPKKQKRSDALEVIYADPRSSTAHLLNLCFQMLQEKEVDLKKLRRHFTWVGNLLGRPADFGFPKAEQEGDRESARLALARAEFFYLASLDNEEFWSLDATRNVRRTVGWELYPQLEHWLVAPYSLTPIPKRPEGDEEVVLAFERAQRWLAEQQLADGSWGGEPFLKKWQKTTGLPADECLLDVGLDWHRVGVSSLALLTLMEGGNTPTQGAYADHVRTGLAYLLSRQDPKTGVLLSERAEYYGSMQVYDHCLATRALCLALPESQSLTLKASATHAVGFLLRARSPQGGWRYQAPSDGDQDSSVTTMAVLALLVAEQAGLSTEPETVHELHVPWRRAALDLYDDLTDPATGRVGYVEMGSLAARAKGINIDYDREGDEALTAAALLGRLLLGESLDNQQDLGLHRDLMLTSQPTERAGHQFMYYWYYGTCAFQKLEGKPSSRWRDSLFKAVLPQQRTESALAGSWDPNGPWGPAGGRVYSTSMMALSLAQYLTPPDSPNRLTGRETTR